MKNKTKQKVIATLFSMAAILIWYINIKNNGFTQRHEIMILLLFIAEAVRLSGLIKIKLNK